MLAKSIDNPLVGFSGRQYADSVRSGLRPPLPPVNPLSLDQEYPYTSEDLMENQLLLTVLTKVIKEGWVSDANNRPSFKDIVIELEQVNI